MLRRIVVLYMLFIPSMLFSGIIPSCFTKNNGQWPEEVRYRTSLSGSVVWITDSGIKSDYFVSSGKGRMKGQIVEMNFAGDANTPEYDAQKKLDYYESFLTSEGIIGKVPCYREIIARNIYDGIDIKYYIENGEFRYDFIVHPGADPDVIRLVFKGQNDMYIENNNLVLDTRFGPILHHKLTAYDNTVGNIFSCSFVLNDEKQIAFNTVAWDSKNDLIIDPAVRCRILDGSFWNEIICLERDNDGFKYFVCRGLEHVYPRDDREYDTAYVNHMMVKTTPDFSHSLYSFYIPTSDININIEKITLNSQNEIVTGFEYCRSMGPYPTTEGCFQPEFVYEKTLYSDIYFAKFNNECTELVAATYLGGLNEDGLNDIAVNSKDEIVLIAYTDSTCFPKTDPETISGDFRRRAVIAKLSADMKDLIFAKYLSPDAGDGAGFLVLDRDDNIYFTGATASDNFPISDNAYLKMEDVEPGHLNSRNFIVKMSADGSSFLASSLLKYQASISLDSLGNVFLLSTGFKNSETTENAYQKVMMEGIEGSNTIDNYCMKLSSDLSTLLAATFLGGSSHEMFRRLESIETDRKGNIYLHSFTHSKDFPVTEDAYESDFRSDTIDFEGYENVTFSVLDNDLSQLFYSTHIGGQYDEYVYGMTVSPDGVAYLVGTTDSWDMKSDEGQVVHGDINSFIFRYQHDVGIQELPLDFDEKLTIYPNPAKTTARLSLPGAPIDRVEIYDLEGRQAGNAGVQYDGASPVINVEGMPAGVYIVQVSSGGRLFSARLVVAHG